MGKLKGTTIKKLTYNHNLPLASFSYPFTSTYPVVVHHCFLPFDFRPYIKFLWIVQKF